MTVGHDVALALVALGTAVITASSLGALLARSDPLTMVHFLSPVTSLGGPLVCAGVCVAEGWGLTTGEILLIVGILFVTGPVMTSATGRLIAQQEGLLKTRGPE